MHRPATIDDLPALLNLGAIMAAELPHYARMPYAPHKVEKFIGGLIESEDGFVHVAIYGNQIVGCMAGMVTEHWMSEARLATELTVYMLPEYRGSRDALRMIRAFIAWAPTRGAITTNLGICSDINVERTAAFYERIGLRPYGLVFEANYGNQ